MQKSNEIAIDQKTIDFLGIFLNNMTEKEILDHVDACVKQGEAA